MLAIPEIITAIVNALLDNIPMIIQAGITLFTSLITNLPQIIIEIVKAVPQILKALIDGFSAGIGSFVEIGKNMVKGLWEGIKSLASWLWDKVSSWASDLWDGICDFFGIHSPSRKMAWIGDMMMEGLSKGIDETAGEVIDSANDMTRDLGSVFDDMSADFSGVPTDFNVTRTLNGVKEPTTTTTGGLAIHLNIDNFNNYSSEDITDLTNEIMETAGNFIKRKGVVFA